MRILKDAAPAALQRDFAYSEHRDTHSRHRPAITGHASGEYDFGFCPVGEGVKPMREATFA
jgi:hypothetical protein